MAKSAPMLTPIAVIAAVLMSSQMSGPAHDAEVDDHRDGERDKHEEAAND